MEKTKTYKCEWCGRRSTEKNKIYEDFWGERSNICILCTESIENNKCRKCGSTISDSSQVRDGLCINCTYEEMKTRNIKRQQVIDGVDLEITRSLFADVEFTEEDYERWVTGGRQDFSSKDLDNSEIRKLWSLLKLNAAGIYDDEEIGRYMEDVEELLIANMQKLIGRKCTVVVAKDSQGRRKVRAGNIIDSKNDVFILSR